MNAIRVRHSLRWILSFVWALSLAASLVDAYAQAPAPEIAAFVDKSQGTNGAIIVHDPTQPFAPYRRYIVPPNSGYPQNLKLVGTAFISYSLNGKVAAVAIGSMQLVTPGAASAQATPRASIAPGSVQVSNDADALAPTCDGKFELVVGYSDVGTPVALVDLNAGAQVATLPYANQLARDAATGDDGSTGLVVLDNAAISNASTIARLTVAPGGALSDSGERLPFGSSDYVVKVRVAPGSHTGVALVNSSTGGGARLVSFAVPGLASKGSVALAGQLGNAIAFDGTGRKIYARSGARASVPDVIQVFDFDPATGMLGQTASLTIGNVSGFTGAGFNNPMDVTADAQLIIAAEEDARGELPAPRITAFSAATGAIVSTFSPPGLLEPQTVATVPACMLPQAAGFDLNRRGLTGSWFQMATAGQGVEVEVYPDLIASGTGFIQAAWFTYDYKASGGAASQRWYTFSGNVQTGQPSSTLTLYENTGGNFDAGPVTSAVPVGTVVFSATDCSHTSMTYNFSDGSGRSGTLPMTRLLPNVTCTSSGAETPSADFGYSGNWYDKATSGQGIVFELNPNQPLAWLTWYTYAPNGQASGEAGQRWYTAQASYAPGVRSIPMTLYQTTGGIFDSAAIAPTTVPVGTATATFSSCGALQLAFNFTGGSSAGASGTINMTRVGPTPGGCGP
jgi:hypothetical protein